jgi:hypothetical protein
MCATLMRARNWFGASCTGDPVRLDQWWHGVPMRQGRQHFRMVRKDYCRWFEKITVGGGNRIARSARPVTTPRCWRCPRELLKNHGIEMADRSDTVHERRSAKLGRLAQLDSTCPRTGLLARGFVARFGTLHFTTRLSMQAQS